MKLADDLPDQISVAAGTLGDYNVFAGGTRAPRRRGPHLVGGAYYGHVDGPFTHPDDFEKIAGALRYSHGTDADGYSATAMYFHAPGQHDDGPAAARGPGRSDRPLRHARSQRRQLLRAHSLSVHYAHRR